MTDPTRRSSPFDLRQRQVVQRMAERLWEQHGHAGQPCEMGSGDDHRACVLAPNASESLSVAGGSAEADSS